MLHSNLVFVDICSLCFPFRISELVDTGNFSLVEFMNGSIISSFNQKLKQRNSKNAFSHSQNDLWASKVNHGIGRTDVAVKRKRSQSPICASGSFGLSSKYYTRHA